MNLLGKARKICLLNLTLYIDIVKEGLCTSLVPYSNSTPAYALTITKGTVTIGAMHTPTCTQDQ